MKLTHTQKHLGFQLDSKLSFNEDINNKISKATKGIGLLRRLQPILPRKSLMIIYKSFIRTHLDYGDFIYDHQPNVLVSNKIQSVHYNVALAITGAIKSSSLDKLFHQLELEYLQQRRWMRILCLLPKFLSTKQTSHIHNLLPQVRNCYRHLNTSNVFTCRTEYLKNFSE